ncbi:Nonribosomal Peptide Synthase (NRPS) [Pseudogymnoascus sp. 05NY08]|nr:Nonribosomal Peptide Synthase (NRPS) [Pseudogymnoascus sp. 05NY08]
MPAALSILNPNPSLLPGPTLLHDLVNWPSSADAADAPALDFLGPEGSGEDERYRYTYAELRRCVDSLAATLHETLRSSSSSSGRRAPGDPDPDPATSASSRPQLIIPLLLPQSPALYIAQLAALQVGAAFCPINLDAPGERIKFIAGDVGAQLIISTRENEEVVTWEGGPRVVLVDKCFSIPPPATLEGKGGLPETVTRTEELAYVMYTSGSTGLPKGVGVSHRAATQSLLAHEVLIPPFTRFLQFAAPSFDVSVFEIFFPLFRGATLIACQRERMLNDLPGTINGMGVDACELTPTVVGSLLLRRANVPGLKLLLTIGEMLTRPVVDEFGYSADKAGMLYGMYGPTEAAIHCTAYTNMAAGSKVGNIGRPFSTVSCLIAAIPSPTSAEPLSILPLGEVGELVLGGTQLADGYLNREKENKAAFVSYNGAPAYRTGDKGRILEDGTIEVMGRISAGQVKLRGQRVELGEIEEVVYKHPGIELAFASVLEGMLIIFARAGKGENVVVEEVVGTCEKWLPRYMVPSEIIVMAAFPYLPSGKIDKKKLEAEYLNTRAEDDGEGGGAGAGAGETEKIVQRALQTLLKVRVNPTKRLAAYGLDSLMAIRLASHLRSARLRISAVEILEAETLREIARVCEERQNQLGGEAEAEASEVFDFSVLETPVREVLAEIGVEDQFEEVLPCTPLQDAMLLETAVDAGAYCNFIELRINGVVDSQHVTEALRELARWNPLLRTGFVECESRWSAFSQVVWGELGEEQVVVVESGDDERGEERGLDMLRPIRMRVCVGEGGAVVRADVHHALYDGWSLELVLRDLETLLSSPLPSTSSSSPDDTKLTTTLTPRPPFRAIVEHTLRLSSRSMEKEKRYWKDHLSHFSPRPLPSFHSSADVARGLDVVAYTTSIPTAALEKSAALAGVNSHAMVQSAYALVLASYLGTKDICFGSVFSGRSADVEGIGEIAGPCIATLPVRIDIGNGTVGSVMAEMQRVGRRHMENESLGLREIQGLAGDEVGGKGVFDTLVIWQQSLSDDSDSDSDDTVVEGGKGGKRKKRVELVKSRDYLEFALTLEITPGTTTTTTGGERSGGEGMLRFDANYQTAIFGREMIQVLLRQVEAVLGVFMEEGMEGGVDGVFGGVQDEGVMAVYEGGGEVSPVLANGGGGGGEVIAAGAPKTRCNRRANLIARLLTGTSSAEVSLQQPLNGKVRGYIGRVGPGVKILVIAPSLEDDIIILPLGAEGELCISFPGLEEAGIEGGKYVEGGEWVEDPVHGRLLRTGDLVRLLPGGEVIYRGRRGEEVLVRGQRVDIGAVEGVVLSHPAVGDGCATVLVENNLITFFTLCGEEGVEGGEFKILDVEREVLEGIYEALDAEVPAYAVPVSIIPVSYLPVTVEGDDVDTETLRSAYAALTLAQVARYANPSASTAEYTWTPLESLILSAVTAVAKSPEAVVKPTTPFAALGIDSIAAIGLVRKLKEGGVKVDVGVVLRFGSVRRLAGWVEGERAKEKAKVIEDKEVGVEGLLTPEEIVFESEMVDEVRSTVGGRGWTVERVLPCTPLQEAMLAASELASVSDSSAAVSESTGGDPSAGDKEEGAYVNRVLLDLKVGIEQVEGAWSEMVKRHEILRTCFVRAGHARYAFCQVVLGGFTHESRVVEVADAAGVEEVMTRGVNWQVAASGGEFKPPYELTYVRIPASEGGEGGGVKLVLAMHHALYDGFAMGVFYEEMETFLRGGELGEAVGFAPFLRYMSGVDAERGDAHWRGLLGNFQPVSFTPSLEEEEGAKVDVGEVRRQNHVLTKALSMSLGDIEERLAHNDASLLSVCQTAWAALLSHRTSSTDIVLGSVVSGRTVPVEGLNRLVAPCFNTIPFRLRNLHRLSYLEAFRTLQEQNVEAVPWQVTGLRRVQALAGVEGGEGGGLFDTLVLVQTPERDMDPAVWRVEEDRGGMDFPVVVEIVPRPGAGDGDGDGGVLEVTLHVHGLPMAKEEVRAVLEGFDRFLKIALQEPREQIVPAASKSKWAAKTAERREKKARAADGDAGAAAEESGVWTDLEIVVREVIAAFTTVPELEIGRGTSIYRLGLDSINAVQVATALRGKGYKVVASDVLMHPSVRELAGWIGSKSASSAGAATDGGVEEEEEYDFKAFEDLYRGKIVKELQVLGVDGEVEGVSGVEYVNSYTLRLSPGVELEKLRRAWGVAVKACPMLRAGFVGTGRGFAVVVYAAEGATVPWVEESGKEGEGEGMGMTVQDLARQPWRLEVLRGEGEVCVKFTAHHALYDAQSLHLIFEDVQAAYSHGTVPEYPSFLPLLGAILNSNSPADKERRKAFWMGQNFAVHRFPDLTPLRVTSERSIVSKMTSKLALAEIEEKCREGGWSVQAVGQAVWARILGAYVGEGRVTFGVTLSGRGVAGGEEIGEVPFPTIVTVPVCYDIGEEGMLDKVMTGIARVAEWQFTPLTDVQRWTGNTGGLFDTLFAYQKSASSDDREVEGKGSGEGEEVWKIVEEDAEADFAVSIEMLPEGGEMVLQLTVKESVVPREQAELMVRQFDALLVDMLTQGGGVGLDEKILSISPPEHPTLSDSEEGDMLLHEFVERQARLTPEKMALEFTTSLEAGEGNTAAWTYAQLDKEANRIARLVQNLGAVQGQLIAICFDKCPEASFSIVGIMKTGSAYVALDPGAPADRVKFIMQDSGATVVLTSGKPAESLKAAFEGSEIQVVDLGTTKLLEGCSTDAPVLSRPIDPQDTSYCLYTSGTTGTPKGCELTHENAVQAMYAFQHIFRGHWTEESKWLQFASFHFDVSVLEQFWSWSVGICVASAPRDLIFEDIPGAIRALGITHLDLTPSLARLLHPDEVPILCKGVFITGGEQLRQDILDVWGEKACIYNGYGPTEATIGVTMYPRVPKNGKPANIGPQFLNVGSFVLKPGTSQPVLRGAVGELCVSGKLVGKGYLNRAELTAERFPYLEALGERVYRTGDLVRICHDGGFLFLGRADDQVKLRGQRLELTEITEVIKRGVEGVGEVVTLVLKHSLQLKEQLVAFFIPAAHIEEPVELIGAIRDACTSRLPGYMVPTHFVPLKALPLSPNNKADGKALARMYDDLSTEDLQRLSAAGQEGRQWTGAEKEVLAVLAECMGVEVAELKSGTNIFELGFDSISVIGLAQRLQHAGYGAAKAAVVMKNSGVEALVGVLVGDAAGDEQGAGGGEAVAAQQRVMAFAQRNLLGAAEEMGVDVEDVEALAPCTAAQAGMIYRFLDSEGPLYFMSFAFELAEGVDVEALREAWGRVVKGLEVLRVGFVFTPDGCAQVVLKEREVPWDIDTDFAGMEKGEALARPWRVGVVEQEGRRMMRLEIFHGLYDGASLPLLLGKVEEEYTGVEGLDYGPSFMSSLPYGPLAPVEGAEAFWKEALETAEFNPLPLLENAQDGDVSVSRRVQGLEHLEALRQSLGVTYQAILQAAWISAFRAQFPASAAPSFGNVVSGRAIDFSGAENVVGPLLNTLVFHVDVKEGMSWKELVQACHVFNVGVMPFQHSPLKDVQKWCGESGRELFDTLFVFQREEVGRVGGLWREVEGEAVADYPMAFEATLMGGGDVMIALVGQGGYVNDEVAGGLLEKVEGALAALKEPEGEIPGVEGSVRGSQPAKRVGEIQIPDTTSDKDFEWTPTASVIRTQISELSKVEESSIAANTTLFSLGLDSIDVIKLASRLKKAGVKISVSAIVKSQTVTKMMGNIQLEQGPVEVKMSIDELEWRLRGSLPKEVVEGATAVLPATPLQEGMVAEMVASGYRKYFNHELYRVKGGADMDGLKKAWETVVAEFDILRTSFVGVEDVEIDVGFAQVVHPASDGGIWRAAEFEGEADLAVDMKQLIDEAIETAKTGSLLQLVDITHGGDRYYLLSISHALYDGWSLQALHANVQKAYNGQTLANPSVRMPLEQLLNANGPDATKYWRTALSGLPKSEFPLHNSTSERVNRFEFASSIPLDDINTFCRGNNISLQTLGQTAWAILLASCLKRLDVAFGVVLSCRDTEESSELMFPLMNTVVVRAVIHGDRKGMLQYMQESSNAMRAYQHFPLRKAQAVSGRQWGALFDTLFIYQGKAQEATGEVLAEAVESQAEVEFKVCVEMEVVAGELVWRVACRDAARTERETEELLRDLDVLVGRIVGDVEAETIVATKGQVALCGLEPFVDESSMAQVNGVAKANGVVKLPKRREGAWSATELAIRGVLSQVSKTPEGEIEKDQSIFHLGLDSISAIKVSSLLRRQDVKITVGEIMKNSSIQEMSALLAQRVDTETETQTRDVEAVIAASLKHIDKTALARDVGVLEGDVEDIMPVSAGQLYMLARWEQTGGAQFEASFQYKLDGAIDTERLEKAWEALTKCHAILRTVFASVEDEGVRAVQVVLKKRSNSVKYASSSETAVSLLDPVFLVVEEVGGVKTISLRLLHAVYDVISLQLLIQDLERLYSNPDSALPPPPSFKEFIARDLDEESRQAQRMFWESYLPRTELASLPETPDLTRRVEIFKPSVPIGDIASAARKAGVTVDALLLAAFSKAYEDTKQSASDDTVIGLYLANRSATTGLSELVAPTLNLVPLRIQSDQSEIEEVASGVQKDLQKLSEVANVGASLADVYRWTGRSVGVFVNILKTSDNARDEKANELFAESLSEMDMLRPRAEVVDIIPNPALLAAFEKREELKEAYLASVDIELRLVDGGRELDVGLFAPEETVRLEEGEKLVEALGEVLRQL